MTLRRYCTFDPASRLARLPVPTLYQRASLHGTEINLTCPVEEKAPRLITMPLEKRLRRELNAITRDPPAGITAGFDGDDIMSWSASIAGPDDSPYAGGVFFLQITYPETYPRHPPTIKFKTKIYHPNISTVDGSVFVDILGRMWCPALTISTLLVSIQSLLTDPNPEDSVEPEIGREYINDREKFDKTAAEWTGKYAMGREPEQESVESSTDTQLEDLTEWVLVST